MWECAAFNDRVVLLTRPTPLPFLGVTQADAANGTSAGSPLPSFFSWVLRQQQAGMLKFQVKREEADGLWADAAGQAPDETPVDAAEGMVESAAEEEECAPEPELAAFARALD